MKCVSYTRVTSCKNKKEAPADIIQQQELRIQKYAQAQGWTLSAKYSDNKRDADANEAFEKLVQDGIERKFDIIIIDSLERCGKSISYAEDIFVKTFFLAGIHFAVVEDDFCSAEKSKAEVTAYVKKRRQRCYAENMHEYMREQQKQGFLTVHDEKYGYLLAEDRRSLHIDDEAAEVIREIFQMAADGMSFAKIVDALNARNVESPMAHMARVGRKNWPKTDAPWSLGAVKRIVQSTAYIGYWNKKVAGEIRTLTIAPIVQRETFEKVQELIKARTTTKNNYAVKRGILAQKIFDKETGAKLYQRNFKSGDIVFLLNARVRELPKTKKTYIKYEIVMDAVRAAVQAEMAQAKKAGRKASEEAEKRKEAIREKYSRQALAVFQEMMGTEQKLIPLYEDFMAGKINEDKYLEEKAAIRNRLFSYDAEFQLIMEELEEEEKAASSKNLWLQVFQEADLPKQLESEHIQKWVERVEVENYSFVVVYPTQREWKEKLPQEWLTEE